MKEKNYLHLENIADLLWLSQFTGMQSVAIKKIEDKENSKPKDKPKIEDNEVEENTKTLEPETEEPQDDLEVHTDSQEKNSTSLKQKSAKAIKSPKKLALDHYREWEKAFKFINLKTPSKNRYELDEEKTVENIASLKVFDLVFRRVEEKSFFLTLVIDQGKTMELWEELIKNFEQMLMTMGVFARVSLYYWDTTNQKPLLYVDKKLKREVSEKIIVTDGQRNLVWVMSDCIAPAWRSGETFKSIERWSTKSFTSILQMFPKRMWMGTMLFKGEHIRLSSNSFNPLNKKLQIKPSIGQRDTLKIPIISFDPYALQAWAKVVVNAKDNNISGIELEDLDFAPIATPPKREVTPEMRMERFYSQASYTAQKLAFYMSVLPVDLQVTRILQEEKLPQSNQAHVAEVFLGGLIERTKKEKNVSYDFYPQIREELNANISADESFEIMESMSDFVSSHLGIGFDVKALLADPNGAFEGEFALSEESLAYARLASRVLKRKGGVFYEVARRIDEKLTKQVKKHNVEKIEKQIRILFLIANPTNESFFNEEYRNIESIIEESTYFNKIDVKVKLACRIDDFVDSVLNYEPDIIHFIGHTTKEGLVLCNPEYKENPFEILTTEKVKSIFSKIEYNLELVFINSDTSAYMAEEITQNINFVIGIEDVIEIEPSINFSTLFYKYFFRGRSIKDSFSYAKEATQVKEYKLYKNKSNVVDKEKKKKRISFDKKLKILFLSVNYKPENNDSDYGLALDEEYRNIESIIAKSSYSNKIDLKVKLACRMDDFTQSIISYQPDILHFTGFAGFINPNKENDIETFPKHFDSIFSKVTSNLKLAFFNTSLENPPENMIQNIDCIIVGREGRIDDISIGFSTKFYSHFFRGKSIETSFFHARISQSFEDITTRFKTKLTNKEYHLKEDLFLKFFGRTEKCTISDIMNNECMAFWDKMIYILSKLFYNDIDKLTYYFSNDDIHISFESRKKTVDNWLEGKTKKPNGFASSFSEFKINEYMLNDEPLLPLDAFEIWSFDRFKKRVDEYLELKSKKIKFSFLKANSGESIIVSTENTNIIIDGGTVRTYKQELKHKIEDMSVLDLVIVTHRDDNHAGGIWKLIEDDRNRKKINKIWFNGFFKENEIRKSIILSEHLIQKYNIPYKKDIFLSEENSYQSYQINDIQLELLSPMKKDYEYNNMRKISNQNILSIAFILKYQNKKFLFLADAHIEVIKYSLQRLGYSKENRLEVNFIKLSHGGSIKNIDSEFLDMVSTDRYVILTDGRKFDFPHKETLELILTHELRAESIEFICNYKNVLENKLSDEEVMRYNCELVYATSMEF